MVTRIVDEKEIENISFELLLEGIYKVYGYDFRSYAKASLKRRLNEFVQENNVPNYFELLNSLIQDEEYFRKLLLKLTVTVTEMFRDPNFFKYFRETVIPFLRTYPSIRIWHAGCATGEEAYSMAILLKEEGLLKRSIIYATDINNNSLDIAKEGIYSIEKMRKFSENYLAAGGIESFSNYYRVKYNSAIISDEFRDKIHFMHHNLGVDQVFAHFNVILCRNVLIYFDNKMQNQVLDLIYQSLEHCGYLCLGGKEPLSGLPFENEYKRLSPRMCVYQKLR